MSLEVVVVGVGEGGGGVENVTLVEFIYGELLACQMAITGVSIPSCLPLYIYTN